jgi:hypothetical protein
LRVPTRNIIEKPRLGTRETRLVFTQGSVKSDVIKNQDDFTIKINCMKIKLLLLFLSFISIDTYSQVSSGSFTVGGSSASYYPVLFSVSGVDGLSSLGKLSVYIDDVHANGSWSGSFHSDIEFISSNWGNMPTAIVEFTYITGRGSTYRDPIGDITDGSTAWGSSQLVIWLKGGATYQWSTTLNSRVSLMDANSTGTTKTSLSGNPLNILTSQSQLVLNAKNNRFYESIGLGTSGNGYFGGKVRIGTTTPTFGKLQVNNITSYGNYGPDIQTITANNTNANGMGGFFGIVGRSGNNSDPYTWAGLGGGKSTVTGNGEYGGYLTLWTTSNGENGQAASGMYERMRITSAGNLGIGTTNPDQKLTVKGKIHAEEVIVDLNVPVADYVFKPTYKLMPLPEVEQFVKENSHLPEIPSAKEITKNGLSMGEMQNKLLQKVEELTLYMIGQQKTIDLQQAQIKELNNKLSKLNKQ